MYGRLPRGKGGVWLRHVVGRGHGRQASDRGAYSRFTRAVAEAELTRFIQADYTADRFSWSRDEVAIAEAERFDGQFALLTNAPT